ncbi:sorting nexin-19-like [Moschus berezovskii]|uniref:sorting nexin-19-like n=1 Tax=Moschus berezovskii TaxID=68408 RepID=UPI002444C3A8|nr:sorting nexin-19-like [Moschus berezovskii]
MVRTRGERNEGIQRRRVPKQEEVTSNNKCALEQKKINGFTLIQRWLEVQVAHLTCPQRWVQYLRLLQESIWPGGALPKCPRPVRTPEQKAAAEKQALQSLMGVLPDVIVEILGENKCRLSWSLVLESLQQPLINRHLIYCLWDIILELLELNASAEESAVTSSTADTPGRRASPLSQRPLSRFFEG